MKTIFFAALFAFANPTVTATASPNHEHPTPRIAPEFEKLKALEGTWEGTAVGTKEGEPGNKATVIYDVTSGGTALIEKLAPDTPHEMISMYASASNGKDVSMTHFCALGNQPKMKLKSAKDGVYVFEMKGNEGITNPKEMHMHALTLTLNGDKLKQEWVNYLNGKKSQMAVFEFTKKK